MQEMVIKTVTNEDLIKYLEKSGEDLVFGSS